VSADIATKKWHRSTGARPRHGLAMAAMERRYPRIDFLPRLIPAAYHHS